MEKLETQMGRVNYQRSPIGWRLNFSLLWRKKVRRMWRELGMVTPTCDPTDQR